MITLAPAGKSLSSVAVHEAGHVIVAAALRIGWTTVRVHYPHAVGGRYGQTQAAPGWAGHPLGHGLAMLAAGAAAERVVFGPPATWHRLAVAGCDRKMGAVLLAAHTGRDPDETAALLAMCGPPAHLAVTILAGQRRLLDAVAAHLRTFRRMWPGEFAHLAGPAWRPLDTSAVPARLAAAQPAGGPGGR